MSTMLLLFIVLYFLKECGLKDFFFPNIRVVVTASRVLLHSRRSSALLTLLVEKLPFARLDGRVVLLRIAANHGPLHFGLMVPWAEKKKGKNKRAAFTPLKLVLLERRVCWVPCLILSLYRPTMCIRKEKGFAKQLASSSSRVKSFTNTRFEKTMKRKSTTTTTTSQDPKKKNLRGLWYQGGHS